MKKIVIIALLLIAPLAFAKTVLLNLYEQPLEKSKVVAKVSSVEGLVPFYEKGDWAKVGDSTTGKVGWLRKENFSNPQLSDDKNTVEINTTAMKVVKNGKGKEKIIAFENGKPVSEARAKKLWKRMQVEQKKMKEQFTKMQENMLQLQRQMKKMMSNWMQETF